MKQISMREFQLNAPKYLKELPIELTRYKEVVAVVNMATNTSGEIVKPPIKTWYGPETKNATEEAMDKEDAFQKLKKQLENKSEDIVDVSYGEIKVTAPTPPEEPEFTYSKEDI